MTSAFSWQNSISLCPASFHIPKPKLFNFSLNAFQAHKNMTLLNEVTHLRLFVPMEIESFLEKKMF